MAVQVLYFEQIRLRNAMSSSIGPTQFLFSSNCQQFPQRSGSGAGNLLFYPYLLCIHCFYNKPFKVGTIVFIKWNSLSKIMLATPSDVVWNTFCLFGSQGSGAISPRDNYASVRRENRELKLEVARMRMRLTDLEKDHISIKQELVKSNPGTKLFKSFAKKISKLNSLFSFSSLKPSLSGKASSESRFLFQRKRRHSISWFS